MSKITVSVIGASGYTGGELLRLLLGHPDVELLCAVSQSQPGRAIYRAHPNLRHVRNIRFCALEQLKKSDVIFTALPHGTTMHMIENLAHFSKRIIDLGADFRLKTPSAYERWYSTKHSSVNMLDRFVYGLPELHRNEISRSSYIAVPGCNATAVILALYPLMKAGVPLKQVITEVKVGASEGGAKPSPSSHYPERQGSIRVYKPWGHRHEAEIKQELRFDGEVDFYFTATAINMVRGIHTLTHVIPEKPVDEPLLWKIYAGAYSKEPFIRVYSDRSGNCRLPDPKIVMGSNFCDIGFVLDHDTGRIVITSSIDNLMKGAAGQAVQCFNIMMGLPEKEGLGFPGLHPV